MDDILKRLRAYADSWAQCRVCREYERECRCAHPDTSLWKSTPESLMFEDAIAAIEQLRAARKPDFIPDHFPG